jgi:Peptidase C13 family
MIEISKSTLRHLLYGLQAWFFQPIPVDRPRGSWTMLALIIVLCGLLEFAGGWSIHPAKDWAGPLVPIGLGLFVFVAGLLIAGAQRLTGNGASCIAIAVAMMVWPIIPIAIGGALLPTAMTGPMSLFALVLTAVFVLLLWQAIALAVFSARQTQRRPVTFGFSAVLALVASMLVPLAFELRNLDVSKLLAGFPGAEDSEDMQASHRIDVEATFARQAELLDQQLDPLPMSRPDRREIYFVGMAPYADQDVFKREITAARDIVDDRLGTRGRSILMVNHRDTTGTLPLATGTNLERTLRRVAQRMDIEKDILMLFITTHGNEGRMSVDFGAFALNNLTPDGLRGILDRSGIKNRVLVLSACHSGSFIPALEGPDTLIMAAARSDRTSFGCSNERDWTYFGDALFNHALRDTRALPDAFEQAKSLVGKWEAEQKFPLPSEPQMAIGAAIASKLAEHMAQASP